MNNTEPKLIRVETVADLPVLWVILERLQYEHTIRVYQLPTVYGGPELVLSQVIWAYRDQYRVEKGFSRLKGRPLGLTPIYLQSEYRMKGLVHLLSVALRLLTLIEWELRPRAITREWCEVGADLCGPKGASDEPS